MSAALLLQFAVNTLMLGMMYGLVAVGFTLFFGVLDIIVFSHGDAVMLGAFAGLAAYGLLTQYFPDLSIYWLLFWSVAFSLLVMVLFGMAIGRTLIMRLRKAPPLNTLLATMMLGTVLREAVRLFYPNGSNPQPFPHLLGDEVMTFGSFTLRVDDAILFAAGCVVFVLLYLLINRTRLGMAIRSVAQDMEAAQLMGVNFTLVVLTAFAIACGVGSLAGIMNGIYYSEINFDMGLLLGAIGFAAAVIGGLGNVYGAILGGFLFALLQTIGAVALPFSSAYKDVFAFAVVIAFMAWRPTGLLAEKSSQRV